MTLQVPLIPKYPKLIERPEWECSDGRRFSNGAEAKEWEDIIPLRDLLYNETHSLDMDEAEKIARLLLTKFAILPRSTP